MPSLKKFQEDRMKPEFVIRPNEDTIRAELGTRRMYKATISGHECFFRTLEVSGGLLAEALKRAVGLPSDERYLVRLNDPGVTHFVHPSQTFLLLGNPDFVLVPA